MRHVRYKSEGRGFDFRMVSLKIFIVIILPAYSGSSRPEYQEYFLGVKAVGA